MRCPMRGRWHEEDGAVAFLVALLLLPLLAFLGLAIDASRAYLLESRLSQALDAAALAGGRVMFEETRTGDIHKFFHANLPNNYLGAKISNPTITVDDDGQRLTLTASATIGTTFMRLFDQNEMTVTARAVAQRQARGMELALVLDNTGSMGDKHKLEALKSGATDLIDILYGGQERLPNFWVSLVPFVTPVNIGKSHADWLAAGALGSKNYTGVPGGWKGCVEARHLNGNDMTDAPPSVERFQPFYWASGGGNYWPPVDESWQKQAKGDGKGPNLGCADAVSPMVEDRSTILTAIDGLHSWKHGGTMINMGLVWGWRVLSPKWRGLWSAATPQLPLDYGTAYMDKAVVLLTDGKNEIHTEYTAYGKLSQGRLGTTNESMATKELNKRTATACQTMKQQGIIIFTIGLMVADADTHTLLRNCATKPEYYFASPTTEELQRAFRAIGATLSNLRLAE